MRARPLSASVTVIVFVGAAAAALSSLAAGRMPDALPAVAAIAATPPQDPAPGHLVLVVEGTALHLAITHSVDKETPWAGVPIGLQSEFTLAIDDVSGHELARIPLDLSRFETDPARVDAPVAVTGCLVRSPRIGVLVNVPRLDKAARYVFRRGDAVIGATTAADLPRSSR